MNYCTVVYAVEISESAAKNGVISLLQNLKLDNVVVKIGDGISPLLSMEVGRVARVDSVIIAGVGPNTIESILACRNIENPSNTSSSYQSQKGGYEGLDSLQVKNLIIQPSHPYLPSSLLLFRAIFLNGWALDKQRIDHTGNFYRLTSRLTKKPKGIGMEELSVNCSIPSIFCRDYFPDLQNWPLYREALNCSQCRDDGYLCERCEHWMSYLQSQHTHVKKRQLLPVLNAKQQTNINSLAVGIEQHIELLKSRKRQ